MDNREYFLRTYHNPIEIVEAAAVEQPLVGTFSPNGKRDGPTGLGTWFMMDERNMGGENIINCQLKKH